MSGRRKECKPFHWLWDDPLWFFLKRTKGDQGHKSGQCWWLQYIWTYPESLKSKTIMGRESQLTKRPWSSNAPWRQNIKSSHKIILNLKELRPVDVKMIHPGKSVWQSPGISDAIIWRYDLWYVDQDGSNSIQEDLLELKQSLCSFMVGWPLLEWENYKYVTSTETYQSIDWARGIEYGYVQRFVWKESMRGIRTLL